MSQAHVLARPRRRWWLWTAVLLALGLVVAGATAVALTALRTHRRLVDVAAAAGMPRATGDELATAQTLRGAVGGSVGRDPVALAYADPAGGGTLILVGGQLGLVDDGKAALRKATSAFAVSAFRSGTGPVPFTDQPAGPLGGMQRCARVAVGGTPTAVCGWVDTDTVGLAVSPRRTPEQLADLLGRARVDVER